MKLLTEFHTVDEAEEVGRLLEDKGVATFVSSKMTNRYLIPTAAHRVGLWAVIDAQYDDAIKLLDDPDHEVSNPLSFADIIEIKTSIDTGDKSPVLNFLVMALVCMLLIAVAIKLIVYG